MHTAYVSVRHGLLALLATGPRHGYQLRAEFEQHTGGVWPLNVGQVYSTLDRLERDGLVEQDPVQQDAGAEGGNGRPQVAYRVTAQGRLLLDGWLLDTGDELPPPRDELLVKVLLALASGREDVVAIITAQRTARFARLQGWRRAQQATTVLADVLVHDALIARAEAELRWLDQCEARLRAARPSDAPYDDEVTEQHTTKTGGQR